MDTQALPRVLVAEDEPISRKIIQNLIESWGYTVEVAEDGQSAMMALRRRDAPAIAIIDWEMPKMDGIEICKRVREADRTVYILMLTSREEKKDMIEALDAGADDYLVKPCDRDELRVRLRVGERVIRLQRMLAEQVLELRDAKEQLEFHRRHGTI